MLIEDYFQQIHDLAKKFSNYTKTTSAFLRQAINRPARSSSPLKRADISWLQPALASIPEIYFGA